MVFRVAPGQAHQAGDDGDQLGALHAGELQGNLHMTILLDGHHVANLPKYVNDVWKDDVTLARSHEEIFITKFLSIWLLLHLISYMTE